MSLTRDRWVSLQSRTRRLFGASSSEERCSRLWTIGWILFAVGTLTCVARQAPEVWTIYANSLYGFEVKYPSSWRAGEIVGGFAISNYLESESVRGVVTPRNGAEIIVRTAPEGIRDGEAWMRADRLPEKDLEKSKLVLGKSTAGKCEEITVVGRQWEAAPKQDMSVTDYYCVTGDRLLRVTLLHWKDNPHAQELKALGLEVARSITVR